MTCSVAVNCRDDGDYINCYTVTSHGRVHTKQWIHYGHTPSSQISHSEPVDSVTMQLLRDMDFRQVDSVPQCVCQPAESCLKFVVSSRYSHCNNITVCHSGQLAPHNVDSRQSDHDETGIINTHCGSVKCEDKTQMLSDDRAHHHSIDMTDVQMSSNLTSPTSGCHETSPSPSASSSSSSLCRYDTATPGDRDTSTDHTATAGHRDMMSTDHNATAGEIERLYSYVRRKRRWCDSSAVRSERETQTSTCTVNETSSASHQQTDSDVIVPASSSSSAAAAGEHVTLSSSASGQVMLPNVDHATDDMSHCMTLSKGSLLLAQPTSLSIISECDTKSEVLRSFVGTLLAYDVHGRAFYVPAVDMKVVGDPAGEPWFFPVPLTSWQATVLLSTRQTDGCFMVYRESRGSDYRLSVCAGEDVLHYDIVNNEHGDISVAGHDHSFVTLSHLVDYFKHNQSGLATRLRRPLCTSHLPVIPAVDYDGRYELARSQLNVTGSIIANGRFGLICAGRYRNHHVAIKVLSAMCVSGTVSNVVSCGTCVMAALVTLLSLIIIKHTFT